MSLSIEKLDVKIEKSSILHNVSLKVKDGELLSLLGPSGCGKSTLLKAVAGLIDTDGGQIWSGETSLDSLPPDKRGIVVVFQDLRLFSNMNVIDNVAFSMKMQGMKKQQRYPKAGYYLEKVQLSGMENRRISQLSGGQQQRVALARAMAAEPSVLLLDEPFSSLDENLREDMRQLLAELHHEMKNTIVLVTHDRKEALQLSDRVAVMKDGKILQCDTPRRIYEQPANLRVAEYLGLGNPIEGHVEGGTFHGICGAAGIRFQVDHPDGRYQGLLRKASIELGETGLPARLKKVSYLGENYEICAVAGEQEFWFHATSAQVGEKLQEGDSVFLDIDYSQILLFEKSM